MACAGWQPKRGATMLPARDFNQVETRMAHGVHARTLSKTTAPHLSDVCSMPGFPYPQRKREISAGQNRSIPAQKLHRGFSPGLDLKFFVDALQMCAHGAETDPK